MPSRRPTVVTNRKPARRPNPAQPAKPRKFRQSRQSRRAARATRDADLQTIDPSTVNPDALADPAAVAEPYFEEPDHDPEPELVRVPRRARPHATPYQVRAAQNLIDAIGPANAIESMRATGKPKAARLADMMESSDYAAWTFYAKLDSVGLNLVEFTELLLDVKQAKMIARLVTGGEEIAEQVLARATDTYEVHSACRGSGRVLVEDEKTGKLIVTDVECFGCHETPGYILKPAERENVELYLELVKLQKNVVNVDNRKQFNTLNANLLAGGVGDLGSLDGAPDINSIIKRADEQMLVPPSRQVTSGEDRVPDLIMPEDRVETVEAVVEAEVVEPTVR